MSAIARNVQNTRFKIGWILLLTATGLLAINHVMLIFTESDPTLFIGYAVFNFYALVVLAIPFRQLEKWAWYATWILPIGLAAPASINPSIAILYYSFTALCVLGLLLTRPEFFGRD